MTLFLSVALNAATFTVTNSNSSGPGSLRQAMLDAQYSTNAKIVFGIAGTAPFTIDVDEPLPLMYRAVSIDGTSQPGYVGTPLIAIVNHTALPAIDLRGGSSNVSGLRFLLTRGEGVISRADGDFVSRCVFERLGEPSANETSSIRLQGSGARVGLNRASFGTCVLVEGGSGNWISTNTLDGCYLFAIALTGGDHTGINTENVIGGTLVAGSPSVIIDRNATNTYLGESTIANASNGIEVFGDAAYIQGNFIHDVAGYAIRIDGGQHNKVTRNTIYKTGSGIELANGGNAGIKAPSVFDAIVTPSRTTINGGLPFDQSGFRVIEVFQSDTCDARSPRRMVGSGGISSSSNFSFAIAPITPGAYVTAVATDSQGNSSAFSGCALAQGSAAMPAPVITSIDPTHRVQGTVKIHGANFAANVQVFFGNEPALIHHVDLNEVEVGVSHGSGDVGVVVRNPDGQQATTTFHFDDDCTIYINRSPQTVEAHGNDAATFTVLASSVSGPIAYQWYSGPILNRDHPIANATSSSLTTTPNAGTDYWVELSNPCGLINYDSARFIRTPRRSAPH